MSRHGLVKAAGFKTKIFIFFSGRSPLQPKLLRNTKAHKVQFKFNPPAAILQKWWSLNLRII
jgi:hypothetical protein